MTNENNVSHRDAKLADLREDLEKAIAKATKIDEKIKDLEREIANESIIDNLAAGDTVTYVYGRAANRRVLSGTVRASGKNDKGVTQIKVEYGDGLDAEFQLIDASALLFNADDVAAAQAAIDQANAEREQKEEQE